jgi:hypothetical protein
MTDLMKHRGEVLRALANRKFEPTGNGGILIGAGINAIPMGVFDVEHRRMGDMLARVAGSNVIPTEALNHILSVIIAGGAQALTWYTALFEGNVTPGATLTAATFTATTTECTAYDETTRVEFKEGTPTAGVIDNASNRAIFTMNATKTVYGGALLTASAKSATTGTLLAAARFSAPRNVVAADELSVRYTLTLTSA